jgi:hypothetical protein
VLAAAPVPGQTPRVLDGAPALAPPPEAGLAQLHVVENDGAETAAGSQSIKGITVEVSDASGGAVADAAVTVRLPDSGATGTFADGTHSTVAYTDIKGRAEITGIQWSSVAGSVPMRITATQGTSHAGVLLEKMLTQPVAAAPPASEAVQSADVPEVKEMLANMPPAPSSPFDMPVAKSGASGVTPQPGTPAHAALPNSTAQTQPPSVSVTTTGATGYHPHHGKGKWIIAAVVAAGAGGAMMAMHGKASAPAATVAPLTIGTPSISIGYH